MLETALAKNWKIVAIAEKAKDGKSEANELGIKSSYAYPIVDNWAGKKVLLKSNFGDIKGFEFKNFRKTFAMNMNDLENNFPTIVVCKHHDKYTYSCCKK